MRQAASGTSGGSLRFVAREMACTTGVDRESDGSHSRETRKSRSVTIARLYGGRESKNGFMGRRFGRVWARLPLTCFNPGCRPFWFQLGVPLAGSCCPVPAPVLTHYEPSVVIEQLIQTRQPLAERGSARSGPTKEI